MISHTAQDASSPAMLDTRLWEVQTEFAFLPFGMESLRDAGVSEGCHIFCIQKKVLMYLPDPYCGMYIPLSDDKHRFVRDSSLWSLLVQT